MSATGALVATIAWLALALVGSLILVEQQDRLAFIAYVVALAALYNALRGERAP